MGLYPLALLLLRRIIDDEADCKSDHKGHMGRDFRERQHQHNADNQDNVEPKAFRSCKRVLCEGRASAFRFTGHKACTALFLHFGKPEAHHGNAYDAEYLRRNAVSPDFIRRNLKSCCRPPAWAAPRYNVHDAHGKAGDAQKNDWPYMKLLIKWKKRRDCNQKRRGSRAVQMADDGNKDRCKHQKQDIAPNIFHHLADNPVKHTGIRHDAEKHDCKNK